mmetsp:Transcript_20023/g.3277  ORF Transcript_20023/g.3277 Transcript_20023/m.3277 type:complete len:133 (+) Transcript_20023:380-778(+)
MDIYEGVDNSSNESITLEMLKKVTTKKVKPLFYHVHSERSLFVFSKESKLRIFCYKITNENWFENTILGLIIASSLKLVVDTYYIQEDNDHPYIKSGFYIDMFFTVAFTIESIIKSISLGFIMSRGSYLRES